MKILSKTYKKFIPEKTRINLRLSFLKIFSVFYVGNNYYCNCCNKSFRKFIRKGNIKRLNVRCPYCNSLERTRLLNYYLKNETNIFVEKNLNVLHFAPEDCLFEQLTKLDINYIDGDINQAYARNIIDITNIEYESNYFDLIICSHVLGHVPNEEKAISEMLRVLKPNGIALIMTLINLNSQETYEDSNIILAKDKLNAYGEHNLERLHGMDFKERISRMGFNVEVIDYREKFSDTEQIKFSLGNGERELIFKCTKS
jgi:SAM-dependent methyltransferase